MIRFLLGCAVGLMVARWLKSQPTYPTVTYYPSVWGETTSDGTGQWTYTSNSPLT